MNAVPSTAAGPGRPSWGSVALWGLLLPALVALTCGLWLAGRDVRAVEDANGYATLGFELTRAQLRNEGVARGLGIGLQLAVLVVPAALFAALLLRTLGLTALAGLVARVLRSAAGRARLCFGVVLFTLLGLVAIALRNGGVARHDLLACAVVTLASLLGLSGTAALARTVSGAAERRSLFGTLASLSLLVGGLGLHGRLHSSAPLLGVALIGGAALAGTLPFLVCANRGPLRLLPWALLLLACVGAGLPLATRPDPAAVQPLAVRRPLNVLVIAVDTLRTDHTTLLPPVEGRRDLTPALRELASRGTVFANATSQSPWTMPAFASILTGEYPTDHGALSILGRLRPSEVTLAEVLREAGYRTAGIVSHIFVDAEHGFAQGFQRFDDSLVSPDGFGIPAPDVTDRALAFLDERPREQPFFLFLHYFDPHHEYIDHPEYDDADWYDGWAKRELPLLDLTRCAELFGEEETQYLRDLYDEEIRGTDREIGRLLAGLRARGLEGETLVVLCADHGEQFMERGYLGHVRNLHEELLQVPLVVTDPGTARPGEVVTSPVETRRAFDEVLDALGVDWGGHGGGGAPVDHTVDGDEPVFAIVWLPDGSPWLRFQKASVREGRWKLIRDYRRGGDQLYALDEDPGERANLAAREPALVERLGALLDAWVLGAVENGKLAEPRELDAADRAKLEALGYM